MSRPSKKRLADRKAAERRAARAALLDLAYRVSPFSALADFVYVECERCGQGQLEAGMPCIVCGHDVARTHALHDSLKAEAESKLRALAAA